VGAGLAAANDPHFGIAIETDGRAPAFLGDLDRMVEATIRSVLGEPHVLHHLLQRPRRSTIAANPAVTVRWQGAEHPLTRRLEHHGASFRQEQRPFVRTGP
jgi:hypothetical protein